MRTLKFEADSIEFTLLHRASLESSFKPSPKQYAMIADIQERLESIGKPILPEGVTTAESSAIYHYSLPKAAYVVLEEEEFSLLKTLFAETQFVNSAARFVRQVHKLLDEAPEEKPVSRLKKL